MKRLLPIVLALIILLAACGTNVSGSFDNYLDKSDTYSNRQLPSGAKIGSCDLQRDVDKYYTVLHFTPYFNDSNSYAWAALTPKEQKEDMKYIADMVMDYAVSKDWDNDYYLYIVFEAPYASFAYDYEADKIYYPKNIGVYRLMYKQFNTMDSNKLLGNEQGEAFLIEYGLAEVKHKQIELIEPTENPVFKICDGKLSEFGLYDPKAY